MRPKKVDVEIVSDKKESKKPVFLQFLGKLKLTIAIILDLVHFFIGWIPFVNSAWSVATFIVLLLILKNKKLAFLSLIELPLILPPFSFIAMILPTASIAVLMDNSMAQMKLYKFNS